MPTKIKLGELVVDVVKKDIKNVHLSVYPPTGRVRISAPLRMSADNIRLFAISKLNWIKQQQRKLLTQDRETPRDYLDRESHYVWGKRYLLKVIELDAPPAVELKHRTLVLQVRSGSDVGRRQAVLETWFREQVKAEVPPLIAKWEPLLGVKVKRFFVQRMKTKWGSCSPHSGSIRLNSELAKKPPGCLEYIVVHEMAHFLEPNHNNRFVAIMDKALPQWRSRRRELNAAPLSHESWSY
ncbi:MAG: SprT family zinc-dependent metalloprotease [Phycisphaeraceae bacterium]